MSYPIAKNLKPGFNGASASSKSHDKVLNPKETLLMKMELDSHIKEYERKVNIQAREEEEEKARIKKQALDLLFMKDNTKSKKSSSAFDNLENKGVKSEPSKDMKGISFESKLLPQFKVEEASGILTNKRIEEGRNFTKNQSQSNNSKMTETQNQDLAPQLSLQKSDFNSPNENYKNELTNFTTFGKEEPVVINPSSSTFGLREVSEKFKNRNTAKFVNLDEFYSDRDLESGSNSLVESKQIASRNFGPRENYLGQSFIPGEEKKSNNNSSLEIYNKSIETKFETLNSQLECYQLEEDDDNTEQKPQKNKRTNNNPTHNIIHEEKEDSDPDNQADNEINETYNEPQHQNEADTDYEDAEAQPRDSTFEVIGFPPNQSDPNVFDRMEYLLQKIKNNAALNTHLRENQENEEKGYEDDEDYYENGYKHYNHSNYTGTQHHYEEEEDEEQFERGQCFGENEKEGEDADEGEEETLERDEEYEDQRRSEMLCDKYSESLYEKSVDPNDRNKLGGDFFCTSKERSFAEPSIVSAEEAGKQRHAEKISKRESNLTYSKTNPTSVSGVNALSKNFSSKEYESGGQYSSYDYSQRSVRQQLRNDSYKTPSHSELIKLMGRKNLSDDDEKLEKEKADLLIQTSKQKLTANNEEEIDFDQGEYEYEEKHSDMDFMLTQDKKALWSLLKEKDEEGSSNDESVQKLDQSKKPVSKSPIVEDVSSKNPSLAAIREPSLLVEKPEQSGVLDNGGKSISENSLCQENQKNYVNFEIPLEEYDPDFEKKKRQFELLRKKKTEEFEREKVRKMISLQEKQLKKQLNQEQQDANPNEKYIHLHKRKEKGDMDDIPSKQVGDQNRVIRRKEKASEDIHIKGGGGQQNLKEETKKYVQENQKMSSRPVSGHKIEEIKLKQNKDQDVKPSPAKISRTNNILSKQTEFDEIPKSKTTIKEKPGVKEFEDFSNQKLIPSSPFGVKSPGNKLVGRPAEDKEEKFLAKNTEKPSENSLQRNDKKRPSFNKPSNKKLIINALSNVCLAGDPNKKEREAILEKFQEFNEDNYIIVFKSATGRQDFKGLYSFNSGNNMVKKLMGPLALPPYIEPSDVQAYYRYDSGAKEFKVIASNKNFSIAIDAVALKKGK